MSVNVNGSSKKLIVFTLLLLLSATALLVMKKNTNLFAQASAVNQKPASVVPQKEAMKFGVAVSDYANAQKTVTNLEQQLGTTITTLSIFKQFGHPHNKYLSQDKLQYAKDNKKTLLIAWEPWNPDEGNAQKVDYLKEIPTGSHDAYIREFARSIKTYGSPVSLRFGHEMNGAWYPWGKRPKEYTAAYRYIHKIFKEEKVTNVTWVWCVNVTNTPQELSSYYPGNDVVDVVGMDGFNFGTSAANGKWRSFDDLFEPTYKTLTKNYKKPIAISEIGSTEQGGDKALWVHDMFISLPKKLPKVREIVWFNLNKETDWRVNSSSFSLKSFRQNL